MFSEPTKNTNSEMATLQQREAIINLGCSICIDDSIDSDLLHNILSRLPASSFAFAACVSRSWNSICSRILSYPKLSSAFSLNPSIQDAVNEVIRKVLSEPIRPQFAIAHVGPSFSLTQAHKLITERLGSRIPVVTSLSDGIIGRDALTGEFKEVLWEETDDDEEFGDHNNLLPNKGVSLTVGYLPGLKVDLIPLLSQDKELRGLLIDKFVMDIREYTASVSGSTSPGGIILFADLKSDMRLVLQGMGYAFSLETIIVGEGGVRSSFRSNCGGHTSTSRNNAVAAVALLFVKDGDKSPGIGEIQFHVALSTGLRPFGTTYKAASVKPAYSDRCTWLSARREGINEDLDGQTILDNFYNEIGDHTQQNLALYIGVKKRRKCSIWLEKVRLLTFLEFHEVMGGDDEYLYVNDVGIRTGDSFQFYFSDSNTVFSSCNDIFENFKILKQDYDNKHNESTSLGVASNSNKKSVFGGFIFASCGRGEPFFGRSNVDSMPFLENFPGVTLAGSICSGEIKHGYMSSYGQEPEEQSCGCCSLHLFSTVYLVLSYTPAQQEG